jgi:hypothetical protein
VGVPQTRSNEYQVIGAAVLGALIGTYPGFANCFSSGLPGAGVCLADGEVNALTYKIIISFVPAMVGAFGLYRLVQSRSLHSSGARDAAEKAWDSAQSWAMGALVMNLVGWILIAMAVVNHDFSGPT